MWFRRPRDFIPCATEGCKCKECTPINEPKELCILDRTKSKPPLAIKFDCNVHGMCCYCYNTLQYARGKDETDPQPSLGTEVEGTEACLKEDEKWEAWYWRRIDRMRERWEPIASKCPKCVLKTIQQHQFPKDEDGKTVYPTREGYTAAEEWY